MTTFTGNSGDNILPLAGLDNSGDDSLYGLAGNDVLNGGTGNDLLVGGTGVDTQYSCTGDNSLTGASGKEWAVTGRYPAGHRQTARYTCSNFASAPAGHSTMAGS